MAAYTPMIQQYLRVKADYEHAFLFFRLGDFYEMFFDDAIKASQELEITLTSRDGGGAERIPMCGVPHHSAHQYIEQLVKKGYRVAICEQTEDPKQAKGVVRREVVQLITPGTVMEGRGLHEKENNYLASVTCFTDGTYGFACTDISTGENRVTILNQHFTDVLNELSTTGAKEVVVASDFSEELLQKMKERSVVTVSVEDDTTVDASFADLFEQITDEKHQLTMSRLLNYLYRTQKRSLSHLQKVTTYEIKQYMTIDYFSKRNLELTETIRSQGKKGSLIWLLDETMTAMGGRMLKAWIDRPLINRTAIEYRHAFVDTLITHFFERQELREILREVYDLERLAGRVAFGNVNARDLIQLKQSLAHVPAMKELISNLASKEAIALANQLDPCEPVTELLSRALMDNPPISIKEGNIIKDGYNEQLDKYRDASKNGKTWLTELEKQERERTGIKSLKIGYNRVFGYYIEVTKANLHLLKEDQYERKQTLANAERFITPELKEKEALILQAEEQSVELEYELFSEIREFVKKYIPTIQQLAKYISELDVLQCFATVSEERHYTKPQFVEDRSIQITAGRHPVVEKVMGAQEYVPNDCIMNDEREILIITGPNMSGKSTYMRQIALTAILAQIGCYVPAAEAKLPIFDQIFTRIGAADDLISGQSTFMVEMLEANHAITHATKNSFILFDEIGRGTSTYDGMALAQAMIEFIHERIGAKTLFSTHYHELTVLEEMLPSVKNVHVSAIEQQGTVVFLHQIKDGPADKSYGIHVAKLANLPNDLIVRANEILRVLEDNKQDSKQISATQVDNHHHQASHGTEAEEAQQASQLSFFEPPATPKKHVITSKEKEVVQQIKSLNLLDMTPLETMNTLFSIQNKLRK